MKFDANFYKGKKVLITGHTGFKGTWMCKVLINCGAEVIGYSLNAPTNPSLFELSGVKNEINSIVGDVRDLEHLKKVFDEYQPEVVIHMAAQPIVRESYKNPVYTYEVNVMGTVNVLECVRLCKSVKSVVNVTTDKVYLNKEWEWGFRENEELNGYDPYSNSKSCSELVTSSYINAYFNEMPIAVSTARAGNVIGGGDFAADRIIPDCIRSARNNETIIVRNPYSTRPYQHVLEPVLVYLLIAQEQYSNKELASSYNVGPDDIDCWTTGDLVDEFCKKWNEVNECNISWKNVCDHGPHEANFLKLDCAKIKSTFKWKPVWNVSYTIEKIVEWTNTYFNGGNISECMDKQINEFLS